MNNWPLIHPSPSSKPIHFRRTAQQCAVIASTLTLCAYQMAHADDLAQRTSENDPIPPVATRVLPRRRNAAKIPQKPQFPHKEKGIMSYARWPKAQHHAVIHAKHELVMRPPAWRARANL